MPVESDIWCDEIKQVMMLNVGVRRTRNHISPKKRLNSEATSTQKLHDNIV